MTDQGAQGLDSLRMALSAIHLKVFVSLLWKTIDPASVYSTLQCFMEMGIFGGQISYVCECRNMGSIQGRSLETSCDTESPPKNSYSLRGML